MVTREFINDLTLLMQRHGIGASSHSPDFILAAHVANCLVAYENTQKERLRYLGIETPDLGAPHDAEDPEYLDVRAFNQKFNMMVHDAPVMLSERLAQERRAHMQEELNEFMDASVARDINGMADALIDLVYFAKGTAVKMGLPWRALWDDVQRANMAKVPGITRRGPMFRHDVEKPEGWVGPQTAEILRTAGYLVLRGPVDYPEYLLQCQAAENPIGGQER